MYKVLEKKREQVNNMEFEGLNANNFAGDFANTNMPMGQNIDQQQNYYQSNNIAPNQFGQQFVQNNNDNFVNSEYNNANMNNYNNGYNYNQQYYQPQQNLQNVNANYNYQNEIVNNDYQDPTEMVNPTVYKAGTVKKEKLNTKAKLLIAVYFFIIAVVATLLFINVANAENTPTSASGEQTATYNESVVGKAVDSEGNIVDIGTMEPVVNYEYEVEQSWFDKMCEKVSNILGK